MNVHEIADSLKNDDAKIILLFGFNAVGKTQLSVAYKDATKSEDGQHAGIYYNAYSEDLFVWDNDTKNDEAHIKMRVHPSSLSKLHNQLNEIDVRKKLEPYRPKFEFRFKFFDDAEKGIDSIEFYIPSAEPGSEPGDEPSIKIARGEERVFVWCFFLALMEVEGWADKQSSHIFIDDPVSSLDDHNIFVTASTLYDLIEKHIASRRIIIATHHIGLFSILYDWLKKGEKSGTYKKNTAAYLLSSKSGELTLETERSDVFLYHLRVLQVLEKAQRADDVRSYHLALLRQVLENVASFLGVGRISFVLEQIGVDDPDETARIVNVLSHKSVYYYESDELVPDTRDIFDHIFDGLKDKYNFVLHASEA